MRWTKPASLEDSYDVRLVGWPPTVEVRNPSNNTVNDNRLLLDLVRKGKLKFVKRGSQEWGLVGSATGQSDRAREFSRGPVPATQHCSSSPDITTQSPMICGASLGSVLSVSPQQTEDNSSSLADHALKQEPTKRHAERSIEELVSEGKQDHLKRAKFDAGDGARRL